jgi:hypothetical protein
VRADLGEPPLGELGMPLVEGARDRELEDAVPEELEPLVRERPVRRPRRMGEDTVGTPTRQFVDQACEGPRVGLESAAIGAM